MKGLHMVTFALVVIGGLNWLLIGIFGSSADVVMWLGNVLSASSWLPRLVFILVGLSAIWEVVQHGKNCKMCGSGGMQSSM